MPTYEYRCSKCRHEFEALQSFSDAPIKKCSKCSGKTERLLSSGAGLIFKGTGFYKTDYASSSKVSPKKDSTPKLPSKKSE